MPLTKETVPEPLLTRLTLRFGKDTLEVMLYNPLQDQAIIHRRFELPKEKTEHLAAIENFIYDNPVLTAEFQNTKILFDTPDFTILPAEIDDSELIGKTLKAACPDIEQPYEIIINPIAGLDATLVFAVPQNVINFVRRTFLNADVMHSLVPLSLYFASRWAAGAPPRMFVNLRHDEMDVIVTGHGRLLFANRVVIRNPDDAVYYITALDKKVTPVEEILIGGNRELRDDLIGHLRRFHNYVMPMIFPSDMFRAGAESIDMPFDMVVTPLC